MRRTAITAARLLLALPFASVVRTIHAPPRVKRNSPCPCGSGKKFKHCHLVKPEPSVITPIDHQPPAPEQ
ncbi:MAG: SEC-C domain-containing protein [Patescibacteria group bacterium]|nr:SEC-C domain-containing protein [Patescibacteria group bacterium]